MDKMSGFLGRIPRSIRSDNLASLIGLGSSSQPQPQAIDADEARRRDHESLAQLSRVQIGNNGFSAVEMEEFHLAVQKPIPETGLQNGSHFVGPDDADVDVSDEESGNDGALRNGHYDSLEKRSPAQRSPADINPSYFDAVRSSPSQGFGFSSARFMESSSSSHNLSMADIDLEGDLAADSPTQTGGFGISGVERSPTRVGLAFGSRPFDPSVTPPQILDIETPDIELLEELSHALPREGKDSPFRSYYGHEPNLSDIDEGTEPESVFGPVSGPASLPSPGKNRHEKRSRSASIAKMQSSPYARGSPSFEGGDKSPSPAQTNTVGSTHLDGSGSANSGSHRQNSNDGDADNASALGFNVAAGSLPQIAEENDVDSAKARAEAIFAAMKDPFRLVADTSQLPGNDTAPVPYDFSNTDRRPLPITLNERTRLFNEPRFVNDGVIPQEYIRFDTQEPNQTQAALTEHPEQPDPDQSEPQEPHGPPTDDAESQNSQPESPRPAPPVYPVRGSSLNATPGKNSASAAAMKSSDLLNEEKFDLCTLMAKEFRGTALGKIAEGSCVRGSDGAVTFRIIESPELDQNGKPTANSIIALGVFSNVIFDIMEKAGRSTKTAAEIYKAQATSDSIEQILGSIVSHNTEAVRLENLDGSAVDLRLVDSMWSEPIDTAFSEHNADGALRSTGGAMTAWGSDITAEFDGIIANGATSPVFEPPSNLRSPSLSAGTNVGSIAPGTAGGAAAGSASRIPRLFGRPTGQGDIGNMDDVFGGNTTPRNTANLAGSQGTLQNLSKILGHDLPSVNPVSFLGAERSFGSLGNIFGRSSDGGEAFGSVDDILNRGAPDGKCVGSASRATTPKPKAKASYGLFPKTTATQRSPSQAVTTGKNLSLDKPLPADAIPSSPFKAVASTSRPSLNKPLPAISPKSDSLPASPAVSPSFPGLPALQRTPAEKKELAKVKKFGSDMKNKLRRFWSKSNEDLVAEQVKDRESRSENANRLRALAVAMDQAPTSLFRKQPLAENADVSENVGLQMAIPKKRSNASMSAIVAAMGLSGGRRKSIGENTRVNGA